MANIDPNVWGGAGWVFLRNIAKGYPDNPTIEDKNNYTIYFESIQHILPCSTCRNNYAKHIKEIPISNYLNNKNQLLNWVNIIRDKSKPIPIVKPIRNPATIQERILRIKQNRKARAIAARTRGCKRCGKK